MKKLRYLIPFALMALFAGLYSCEEFESTGLNEDQVVAGLKEALRVGTDTSVAKANQTNGYYQNEAIKLALPPEADNVVTVVSNLPGGDQLLAQLELKLNRAAEEAAKEATPIFTDAITNLTIADGFTILNGTDTAATHYLRQNTSAELYAAYKPDIEAALTQVGAQQAWDEVITQYNTVPFVEPVNADLADYTTNEALDGLFILVAEEEKKIRLDPVHRVTQLLEEVFGSGN